MEICKSQNAEIWSGDSFKDDKKSDVLIFEILIFHDFLGGQSPNFGPNRPFNFMSKSTIFSTKCVFLYIWQYRLHGNGHKIKSNDT